MTKDNFDIIIIGAGVSGLILAHEIIERTNKSVLMLEKEKKIVMNKNLCFWNYPRNILTQYAENIWDDISILIDDKKISLNSDNYKYLTIKYKSLKGFFIRKLNKEKRFKILPNLNVQRIENKKIKFQSK